MTYLKYRAKQTNQKWFDDVCMVLEHIALAIPGLQVGNFIEYEFMLISKIIRNPNLYSTLDYSDESLNDLNNSLRFEGENEEY